jgi:signal transduction histidine kinase
MSGALTANLPDTGGLSGAQLHVLATLCSDISEAPGLPTVVARLAVGLSRLLPFDQLALAMRAPDGKSWALIRPRLASGVEPSWLELADPESALEEAIDRAQPIRRHVERGHQLPPGLEASTLIRDLSLFPNALCLPVQGQGGALGAIGVFSAAGQAYTMADVHLLSVLVPLIEATARRLVLLEEMALAQREAKFAQTLRAEINHLLHNELQAPLTVIENGLDFLQSAMLPVEAHDAREHVEELRLVGGTLLEVVENEIELTKIESGSVFPQLQTVRLDAWLKDRAARRAGAARIAEVQLTARADPFEVVGLIDPTILGRVIDNLLINALRHTPRRGQVALVARVAPGTITVAIADTGMAIPMEQRESLFIKPTFDESQPLKPPSRGFGLPYCKAAVELHGGRLTIESPPSGGNLFRIVLPV